MMVLSYYGALKAWLHQPLFWIWGPSLWTLRLPMLVLGATTVWLLYRWLRLSAGRTAAVTGSVLLATDASYLVFTVADYSAALPHLFLLAAITPLIQPPPTAARIAWACFFAGLGVWDKALFLWLIGALIAGGAAAYPRAMIRAATPRNLAAAALFFTLGALPFLAYNVTYRGATYTANTVFDASHMQYKAIIAARTLDGSLFLGFGTHEAETEKLRPAEGVIEKMSAGLARLTRWPERNWMVWALAGAFLWTPFAGRLRRQLIFAWVFLLTGWLQMAVIQGTGMAAHHALLLWPIPAFAIAVALQSAIERFPGKRSLLAAAGALLCVVNLLSVNRLYASLIEKGPSFIYTDAIYPLADYALGTQGNRFVMADWGATDTLCLLSSARLPLANIGVELAQPQLTESARRLLLWNFEQPVTIFVRRVPGSEFMAGNGERLERIARQEGYAIQDLREYRDRNGRKRLETFRLQKAQ